METHAYQNNIGTLKLPLITGGIPFIKNASNCTRHNYNNNDDMNET